MATTTVSLTAADLSNQFSGVMNPANLAPLEAAVTGVLNAAPHNMGVGNVQARINQPGNSVTFTMTPAGLDPVAIKAALR